MEHRKTDPSIRLSVAFSSIGMAEFVLMLGGMRMLFFQSFLEFWSDMKFSRLPEPVQVTEHQKAMAWRIYTYFEASYLQRYRMMRG